ncbi:MAG: hypothetical protein K6B71_02140 [Alphaproteobacteria bacterium]|nr:hypothetical protein [Alphaproteobacteria bacterium]
MRYLTGFFTIIALATMSTFVYAAPAAKCSKVNLTHCLDSVCAINAAVNKAARCQYCGTANAGEPPAAKSGLTNVTAGKSMKYALTDKELKLAPTDPGQRYAWGTTECLKKVANCSPDDVSDAYDKLIEQSCKAAGITEKTKVTSADLNQKKNKKQCNTSIENCLTKKCGTGFEKCEAQEDYDRSFSECAVEASGCDEHIASLRTEFDTERKNAANVRETALANLVKKYQTARENRLKTARDSCAKPVSAEYTKCMKQFENLCKTVLKNRCTDDIKKVIDEGLCSFNKSACNFLK